MKKLLLIVSVLLLSACGTSEIQANDTERFTKTTTNDMYLFIVEDTETGCKYLQYSENRYGGGITPLLKSDGTSDCE